MTEPLDIPEAIQWHEGLLLAPQHFQQLALRRDALLHYHTRAMAPFYWGVQRMQIAEAVLVGGTLRLLELEAVMADGLVVTHGLGRGQEEEGLEVDLAPHAREMASQAMPIHLAVPVSIPGSAPTEGTLARYDSCQGHPVADANTGTGELRIPRLRPRLALLATEIPSEKYVSFPLMRVRHENEAFMRTDFLPPTLAVPLLSPLGEMASLIAQRLRQKALYLFDRVRAPSVAMGAPLILETKTIIHSLVAALTSFEAVLSTGVAHPYTLYLALCSLVGHVAMCGASLVPPALEPYNHNDLRPAFEAAKALIFRALDEGIQEAYTAFPLQYDDNVFHIMFEGTWMDRHLVLGVRGQPGMLERDVSTWVGDCLIGSRSLMPSIRERRILGAARQRIDGDADLVPVGGVVLFSLQADPAFIVPNEVLHVFNPPERAGELRPAEIVLYVRGV